MDVNPKPVSYTINMHDTTDFSKPNHITIKSNRILKVADLTAYNESNKF